MRRERERERERGREGGRERQRERDNIPYLPAGKTSDILGGLQVGSVAIAPSRSILAVGGHLASFIKGGTCPPGGPPAGER